MMKRKLILYSSELPHCPASEAIFNSQYETTIANSEEEFYFHVHTTSADAAVICLCSAREEDVEAAIRVDAMTGPVPLLACSKSLNPEFIRKASQKGARRFLVCDMEMMQIRETILDAIRDQGLREYLKMRWPHGDIDSPHVRKVIDEIIYMFPHRLKVREYAERAGIDRGWLDKLFKEVFGIPPTALLRRVWIHQALRMMQHTNLDNREIASQLHYPEESSMAREFRKELGCCPNEARKRLIDQTPEEILH